MDNYEFVAQWVKGRLGGRSGRVLDYGCGAGQIVGLMRARGVDAWGCDVFYGGGDYSTQIPAAVRPFIKRIEGAAIPFAEAEFDIVVSNQVFEHVPDMESVLQEIARVLKPGGFALNLFPDNRGWREGHCGIPFLHWFPKGTKLRVYYAALLRAAGLGYFKEGRTIMGWSRNFCDWLDKWTFYRSHEEILERFSRVIGETKHADEEWLRARLGSRCDVIPGFLQRFIVRKLGCMTLVSVRDHG